MEKIIVFLVVVFVFSSCTSNSYKVEYADCISNKDTIVRSIKVLEKDIVNKGDIDDMIDIDSLVVLEVTEDGLIGDIGKIIVTNDYIYVLDRNIAKTLFCYDKQGLFVNSYKKLGKGPDEYEFISDFEVTSNYVFLKGDYNRFLKLDKTLNLIESIKLRWPDNISPILNKFIMKDENTVVFSSHTTNYHFYFYDIEKRQVTNIVSPVIGRGDIQCEIPFRFSAENEIITTMRYHDTIFSLSPNGLLPFLKVNFEYPLSDNTKLAEKKRDKFAKSSTNISDYMYSPDYFYETSKYITFAFIYKNRKHIYMHDKKSGGTKIFPNNINNDVFGSTYFPIYKGFYKNSIIIPVDAIDLLTSKEKLKIKIPMGLTENSNPVLVFFHPKFE